MWDALFRFLSNQSSKMMLKIDSVIPEVPSQVSNACAGLHDAASQVGTVSYFVPVSAIVAALGIVMLGVGIGVSIVVIRILISFVTLGGGGT